MWTQWGPKEVTVPSVSSNSGVSTDWAGSLIQPLLGWLWEPFLQSWRQKWCFHLEAQSLRHWDQSCTVYRLAHCSPSQTSSDHPVLCTLLTPRFQGDFLLSLPHLQNHQNSLGSFLPLDVAWYVLLPWHHFATLKKIFKNTFLFSVFSWF